MMAGAPGAVDVAAPVVLVPPRLIVLNYRDACDYSVLSAYEVSHILTVGAGLAVRASAAACERATSTLAAARSAR